jgi:hypothetical protein
MRHFKREGTVGILSLNFLLIAIFITDSTVISRTFSVRYRGTPLPPLLLALALLWLSAPTWVHGQEAPRPSLARDYTQATLPVFYNIKEGPILFRFNTSIRTEFNDNVNLGNGTTEAREADLIVTPQLGIDALWTVSSLNTLQLHTVLGYAKYLNHSNLDSTSVLASPDSALNFNIYVGDFKINLHEQFSYQEDPVDQGAVSGVAQFGRLINTAGMEVLWDLNGMIVTTGYDHTDLVTAGATSSAGVSIDTSSLNYESDQINGMVLFNIYASLNAGLEATANDVRYASDAADDATRLSFGPFIEAQLTHYTKIAASGGYQGTFSNGQAVATGTTGSTTTTPGYGGSWYGDLRITNRLNKWVTDQISFGHEDDIGILSAETVTTFARLESSIQIAPQMGLSLGVSFADAQEHGPLPSIFGFSTTHYQLLTATVSTSYQITRKLSASLEYDFAYRTSGATAGQVDQGYTQNRFVLTLGYQF